MPTITITQNVGIACPNLSADVRNIQDALNRIKPTDGGAVPALVVDGACGKKSTDAIQKFQLKHFGWPGADGKIFKTGQTLAKINQLLSGPIVTGPSGVRWRLQFNTDFNSDVLAKTDPWHLLLTDLDAVQNFRFHVRKPGVELSKAKPSLSPSRDFSTQPPLSALDLDGATFRYEYSVTTVAQPNSTTGLGVKVVASTAIAVFTLKSGRKIRVDQVPLRIFETILKMGSPGISGDFIQGTLKNPMTGGS